MPCGEQLGQPHDRDSTQDGSVVTVDGALGCPVSLLWPAAVLAHTAHEGPRTVTMASGLVPRWLWPEVPFLFWQRDVPAGPCGAAQSVASGHRLLGDWRWLGDAGWPGTQDGQGTQDSLPVTAGGHRMAED